MASLSEIVNVVITRDVIVSRTSFGNLLFIAELDAFPTVETPTSTNTRVRRYSSIESVYVDFPTPVDDENPTAEENINLGIRNMAVAFFNHDEKPEYLFIGLKMASDSTYGDALDNIVLNNNQWYAIACQTRVIASQEAVADWVTDNGSTNKKFVGFATDDENLLSEGDDTNIAALLLAKGQNGTQRAFCLYHSKAYIAPGALNANVAIDEWPEVAWFGKCLPKDPGSITWMFKGLGDNVTVDELAGFESTNVRSYFANTYETVAGVAITMEGTVLARTKDYIDNIIGLDWLVARIMENVYTLLANSGKVPYTATGIATVEAKVKEVLAQGVRVGLLSDNPYPVTTVPNSMDIDVQDKVDRILRNVNFTATLSGAIHKVRVNGSITV